MKKLIIISALIAAVAVLVSVEVVQRHGGGGARSAPARPAQRPVQHQAAPPRPQPVEQNRQNIPQVSRTPSMSRSIQQHQPHQVQKTVPNKQIQPYNIQARQQMQQFVQARPQQTNPQNFPQNRNLSPSFQPGSPVTPSVTTNQQLLSTQSTRARSVIQGRHPGRNNWFNDSFFRNHNCYPYYQYSGANWWWAPSWGYVSSWLPYNWTDPYYYSDSGTAYTVPPQTYESETTNPPQQNQDWLPLGVFAVGQTPNAAAYTTMFVQLALDKQGHIAGSYYNTATDEVHELDGIVDQYTQEAAWKVSDNPNSPTMTTGLYNLTQDAAIIQVHFQDGHNQNWTYVRVNQ